jgi:hypothetical protein
MVFTTRLAGGQGGRNALEAELHRLPVAQKNASPTTPRPAARWSGSSRPSRVAGRQPVQPATITELQALLDQFTTISTTNGRTGPCPTAPPRGRLPRPPQALPATSHDHDAHTRVRHDRIDDSGVVTLRVAGRLHHLGVGRTHTRTQVLMLVDDLHGRIVNAVTGELHRELIIDPSRDYQPTGRPPGPQRKQP